MGTTWIRRNWHFVVAVFGFSTIAVPLIMLGLGAGDAWHVIYSANALVDRGTLDVSRPPGHPAVEFLILPAMVKVLSLFGVPFGSQAYLVQLWLVSAASIVLFMKLLARLGVSPRVSLLAAASLALTPAFLEQSVNGEETTWALALQFGAWLALLRPPQVKDEPPSHARVAIAGALLALAVGARPEFGVIGVPMAWLLFRRTGHSIRGLFVFGTVFAVVLCLLWVPVVAANSPLVPIPLSINWRTKLLGGGYKHLFLVLPFPASVVLWAGFFFVAPRYWRRCLDNPSCGFVPIASLITAMFALMFFFYPTKTAFCVPAIAFLLVVLAVAKARVWLIAGLMSLAMALAIRVDLFHNRVFVGPTLMQGEILSIVHGKPGGMLDVVAHAITLVNRPKTVVLVRLSREELEWLVSRHEVSLEPVPFVSGSRTHVFYKSSPHGSSFVVSCDDLSSLDWSRELTRQGYKFLIDGYYYRAAFSPYSVHQQPKAGDRVAVPSESGTLDCILF